MLTLSWLGKNLAWQVGNGKSVLLGIDPIIGTQGLISFPAGFRDFLEDLDIVSLSQAHNTLPRLHKYWYTAEELCIAGDWKLIWDSFTRILELGGIRLNTHSDSMIWAYNKNDGSVSTKLVYDSIVRTYAPSAGSRLLKHIWTGALPSKV